MDPLPGAGQTYVLAWEKKQASLDWRQFVLSRLLSGMSLEVARLKAQASFSSEGERVQAFIERGHGSCATWFNHAKKLRHVSDKPPRLVLTHNAPPALIDSTQQDDIEIASMQFL